MEQSVKADRTIGETIKRARMHAGLTQEQLAARVQVAGCDISRGTLAKIEAGIRHISAQELRALGAVLNLDFNALFGV